MHGFMGISDLCEQRSRIFWYFRAMTEWKMRMLKRFSRWLDLIRRSKCATFGAALVNDEDRALANAHFYYHDHDCLRNLWANLHDVGGGAWRSNQPNPERIAAFAKMGIKTIINLRGTANLSHHLLEKEACKTHGIALESLAFSARRVAPKEEYLALLDLFDTCARPFVIHCKSGADRTGLAAAFFLLHGENKTIEEAQGQLSLRYLHLKWSRAGILDLILETYASDLKAHGAMPVRDWLQNHYDPEAITAASAKR